MQKIIKQCESIFYLVIVIGLTLVIGAFAMWIISVTLHDISTTWCR
jgi:hypothetical protein